VQHLALATWFITHFIFLSRQEIEQPQAQVSNCLSFTHPPLGGLFDLARLSNLLSLRAIKFEKLSPLDRKFLTDVHKKRSD
jgi:hypothetical protein